MGLLSWLGYNDTMEKRGQKAEAIKQLTEEMLHLYKLRQHRPDDGTKKRSGSVAFVSIGSYATHEFPGMIDYHMRVGNDETIAASFLANLARSERRACLKRIDERFHNRITQLDCPNLPDGLQGKTAEEAKRIRRLWLNDVILWTRKWLDDLELNDDHAVLVIVLSPGGHAALLEVIIALYKERFPDKSIYLVTLLDEKDVVRQRLPALRREFHQLVDGTFITDNRRFANRSDLAVKLLFAAMSAGGDLGTSPNPIGNALHYLFAPERKVRYATLAIWADTLPVKHFEAVGKEPEGYYTKLSRLEDKVTRGIQDMYNNRDLQAVPLPAASSGHTRLMYVLVPLDQKVMPAFATRVNTNLTEWREKTDRNLLIHYVSLGADFSPDTVSVPMMIILAQPLADDGRGIDDLAMDVEEPDDTNLLVNLIETEPGEDVEAMPEVEVEPVTEVEVEVQPEVETETSADDTKVRKLALKEIQSRNGRKPERGGSHGQS